DQDRIKDVAKDTTQLDQAVDQLRQAYKEKYQQDLDLSKGSDMVFTAQFFRIGGAPGDSARQAAARIGSDASAAGGAVRDAASAGATAQQQADAAKTAGAAGT